MTKIFLKTLGAFYYERMVASAPIDFTEMVGMGVRLEEVVREGCLTRSENYGNMKNHRREPQQNKTTINKNKQYAS